MHGRRPSTCDRRDRSTVVLLERRGVTLERRCAVAGETSSICLSATAPAVEVLLARLRVPAPELNPATSAKMAMLITVMAISSSTSPKPSSLVASRRKTRPYAPTTLNVGFAIWTRIGPDHLSFLLPGSIGLIPRTR